MKRRIDFIIVSFCLIFILVLFFLGTRSSSKPKISIITSVWDGDEFIEGFLEDVTKQTIFSQSELIIINPNSPGHEEEVIKKYTALYPNIIYVRLPQDPGLYGVWNRAIKMAHADIVTNANIDDRSRLDALEVHVKELEDNPDVDLVYSGYLYTEIPNETFENNHYKYYVDPFEFCSKNMALCLPGPRPVWRKSLHDRYGYFDETFSMSADWGMWLRATSLGAKFKKIPGPFTLYYFNPDGLSTNSKRSLQRKLENDLIISRYSHLWQ